MNIEHSTPPFAPVQPPALGDDTRLTEDALGNLPLPPEIVAPRLALLETWDESVHEFGFRIPPQPTEDEAEYPAICAEEGVDEAEEERRELQEGEERVLEHEAEEAEEARNKGA